MFLYIVQSEMESAQEQGDHIELTKMVEELIQVQQQNSELQRSLWNLEKEVNLLKKGLAERTTLSVFTGGKEEERLLEGAVLHI